MKERIIYLLLNNGNVEQASASVKILHGIIFQLCQVSRSEYPLSYVQVTRVMNENKCYVHTAGPMQAYTIIERKLLFTHRKRVAREGETQVVLGSSAQR
jgi:hypothetical protein